MNKLLGAMVLLLGITSAAVGGGVAVDIDKISKTLNRQDSHIMQIAELDDSQLSLLCEEIVDGGRNDGELKNTLLQECKLKLVDTSSDIAEQIQKVVDNNI